MCTSCTEYPHKSRITSLQHNNPNMSLSSSHDDDPSTSSFSAPLRRSSKPTNADSPATATSATSFHRGASPDETFWANLRQRELRVADSNSDGYKPAYYASDGQILAAVLEFIRREKEGNRDEFPAVLVATNSKQIPIKCSRLMGDLCDWDVGNIKFFLDHHGSLFIVSLSSGHVQENCLHPPDG